MFEFWEFFKKNWEWGETDVVYLERTLSYYFNPKPLGFPGDSIFQDGSALIGIAVLLFFATYYYKRFKSARLLKDNGGEK